MHRVLRERARSSQRGAAAVEFALILVPLCMILFGIINFGDILGARQSVSQAAAEGARAGAVSQKASDADKAAEALAAARETLKTQGESCTSECKAEVKPCDSAAYDCVWVTVVVDHPALVPGFSFGFGGELTYTASARVSD